ncbi:hypothetical protein BUALT_Bualt16G0067100 [Buddleja alternifolia]|uniref:endo-polygalacturonase n=1 Tax=Buddleja alternifolia TaxID=168488 RepID=A0AAV6W7F9_9LAMI|nr:hypothetical protein BUALT_Bualt16G0067100 [Buddleja alternifolia]
MDVFGLLLFVLGLASSNLSAYNGHFSVMDYGATSDDQTDDSQAFLEAWNAACTALHLQSSTVYVPPQKTFLLNPIIFHGPCNPARINFLISGTIMAPESAGEWDGRDASEWLGFKNVNGLHVDGFGLVDGQGKAWWDQSCKYHPQLALKFMSCNESSVSNLKVVNSAQTHIVVKACNRFNIDNLVIESPGNSPNTDGIHIQSSHNVFLTNSKIGAGDDCISIGDYISNIEIRNVECGPGHGISIGSLGRDGNYVQVEKIRVIDAVFNGTSNGARIKTWQAGRGYVRDVTFQNLKFSYVKNPIIIDQNYCYIRNACEEQESGVQISNVNYKEVSGTSSTEIAINLNCSKFVPCFGISMESIQLMSAKAGNDVVASCSNAYGQELDVFPAPCLLR